MVTKIGIRFWLASNFNLEAEKYAPTRLKSGYALGKSIISIS